LALVRNQWPIPFYDNHLEYLQQKFGHLADFQETDVTSNQLYAPVKDYSIKNHIIQDCVTTKTTLLSNTNSCIIPEIFKQQMRLKRYSINTQKAYNSVLRKFLTYYKTIAPQLISDQQVRSYMVYLVEQQQCSDAYQRQTINALKLFYNVLLNRELNNVAVTAPRRKNKLPIVLSEQEVVLLLTQITNLKHKAMLYCIYSAGLRRNELIELKITNIDSQRNCIIVRAAKGNKDRLTLLSEKCLILLREYFKHYRPRDYLFEGAGGGKYSATSLRKIF
jgi:integrase/recombinase XerD